jgi:hypothetical protein
MIREWKTESRLNFDPFGSAMPSFEDGPKKQRSFRQVQATESIEVQDQP